jgi:hypothetical protein
MADFRSAAASSTPSEPSSKAPDTIEVARDRAERRATMWNRARAPWDAIGGSVSGQHSSACSGPRPRVAIRRPIAAAFRIDRLNRICCGISKTDAPGRAWQAPMPMASSAACDGTASAAYRSRAHCIAPADAPGCVDAPADSAGQHAVRGGGAGAKTVITTAGPANRQPPATHRFGRAPAPGT